MVLTATWRNKRAGGFLLFDSLPSNIHYRFQETDYPDNKKFINGCEKHDNCKIVISGFIAFLISKWEESASDIYNAYYKCLLDEYKKNEQKRLDAYKDNLDQLFYEKHILDEQENVRLSQGIFAFLTKVEEDIIRKWVNAYFEYIKKFDTKSTINEQPIMPAKSIEDLLSTAIKYELIQAPEYGSKSYTFDVAILKSLHDVGFSDWLQRECGLEFGDERRYDELCTFDNFKRYLKDSNIKAAKKQAEFEAEKQKHQNDIAPKFNTNANKENTDKPQRTINVEKLKDYFCAKFKGMGNGNINHFDVMIEELKTDRTAKEFAQIAYMIYQSDQMNARKPSTFAGWYRVFCENTGIKQSKGYKPNNLKNPSDAIKKLFNYL
jgi:hypothetical protein